MVMASIRPAGSEEYGEVASLIQEMASVQGRAELASLQQAVLKCDAGCDWFKCLIAEDDGQVCGFIMYCYMYSTWDGRVMYLPGVHVRTESKREIVQNQLLRQCIRIALEMNCSRVQLDSQHDIKTDQSWYKSLGATLLLEWIPVWYDKTVLSSFACRSDKDEKVKKKFAIRPAYKSDAETILYMIQSLAEDEKELYALNITVKDLITDGFGEQCFYNCFVASTTDASQKITTPTCNKTEVPLPSAGMPHDDSLVGYALYMFSYCPLQGRVLHLEDLFVRSEYRKQGLGTVLMKECAQVAIDNGCTRMQLQVLDWNVGPKELYQRQGGVCQVNTLPIRFTKPVLQTLNVFS